MQSIEIKSLLKDFFEAEFPKTDSALTDETDLLNDWFVDSFGIVNTTLFLENKFGIEICRADINAENFRSINTLSSYISSQLNKGD